MNNNLTWYSCVIGIIVAIGAGQIALGIIIPRLWNYVNKEFEKNKTTIPSIPIINLRQISIFYGILETLIFTSCFMLKKPEGIAVWLAFKAIMRWKISDNDPRHVPGSSIYMIGTALNLIFGFIGAFIAYQNFSFVMCI
jgi:hypothetical protein